MNNPDLRSAPALPEVLAEVAAERRQRYTTAARQGGVMPVAHPDLIRVLRRVWACSDFVAEACIRHPDMFTELVGSGDLLIRYPDGEYRRRVDRVLSRCSGDRELGRALRRLRRRELVRIAWRDLAGWADVRETMAQLSDFADACIAVAVHRLHRWQQREMGAPVGADSAAEQSLVVIAMGKLGGRELNFSSDVDLIFAFPEQGETRGRCHPVSNEQYFIELGQRLIRVLSEITEDGLVFRTDMRLRPFGESGPLAVSFDALEDYYQTHGRAWERYAMVRARIITGNASARARLAAILRPFVYRRYLDYTTFQELRDMKQLIMQEVARKGLAHNIKLGAGGIREIEFIAHTFQLIRGGRRAELQAHELVEVIERLKRGGYLAAHICDDLRADYLFLRRLENHLQAYADCQVHALPEDPLQQAAVAYSMGHGEWPALDQETAWRRRRVHGYFTQIVSTATADDGPPRRTALWHDLWPGTQDREQAVAALAARGMDEPEQAWELLEQLRQSACYRAMTERARRHLDAVMPSLLSVVVETERPVATLRRLIELIECVAQRTAYLALLAEFPQALAQLVKLFAASGWIADFITRHPLLLDELLEPQRLYAPLDQMQLRQSLQAELAQVAADDLEQQMEALRHFKQTHVLRVAAADITAALPLMVVSDRLTDIAEVVLAAVLDLAWRYLTGRHGRPQYVVNEKRYDAGFAVIGYGKLGGIELGYGSDLDLVFLHDSDGRESATTGPHIVDNQVFFARLGQRIIHILSTYTPSGVLYEVDVRLRPSGASGLLVSNLDSFAEYQHSQAWTWEHQALVRARFVVGDEAIGARFNAVRREVLAQPRAAAALRGEVVEMRERMRAAQGRRPESRFDLKHDRGGIADIEFMVQYEVLLWAHEHPELLRWTDNIRLLQGLAENGLLADRDVRLLMDAYRFYRFKVHRLTLQAAPTVVSVEDVKAYQSGVERLWRQIMEGPL